MPIGGNCGNNGEGCKLYNLGMIGEYNFYKAAMLSIVSFTLLSI